MMFGGGGKHLVATPTWLHPQHRLQYAGKSIAQEAEIGFLDYEQ